MNENNDIDQEYFETVSFFGKEYFSEVLSDLTRSRQSSLLVISVITILVAYTLITPIDSSFVGVNFQFKDIKIFSILAGLFCVYYLLAFITSLYQDWQLSKYRKMPASLQIEVLQEKLLRRHLDRLAKAKKLTDKSGALLSARSELIEKRTLLSNKHKAEIDDMRSLRVADDEIIARQKTQLQEMSALEKSLEDLVNSDGLSEIIAETNRVAFEEYDNASNKLLFMQETIKKHKRLNGVIIFIEIVFPLLLSLTAVVSTIWAIFFK
jgi:hypothetical protein